MQDSLSRLLMRLNFKITSNKGKIEENTMDVQDITKQKLLVNKAKSNYDNFIDDQHGQNHKCAQVGYWLKKHSNHMLSEKNRTRGKNIVYRPGTLIRVDFGVNVGSELSGSHFAVVLNKSDNEFNNVVNVVPLTSKNGRHRIDIGFEVFDRVIEECKVQSKNVFKNRDEFDKFYELFNKIQKLEEATPELEPLLSSLLSLMCSRFGETFDLDEFHSKDDDDRNKWLDEIIAKYKNYMRDLTIQIEDLSKVLKTYSEKYRNNTYADVTQITTVSKLRIMSRINSFDPMGSISVRTDILNQIREELVKRIA